MQNFGFILIDDDRLVLTFSRMLINKVMGKQEVMAFENPVHGLTFLQTEIDCFAKDLQIILFLDINMPEMNGWEFLEQFEFLPQKVKDRIKIYILSSSVDHRDKDLAKANKYVSAFIVKPLTREALLQCVSFAPPSINHADRALNQIKPTIPSIQLK